MSSSTEKLRIRVDYLIVSYDDAHVRLTLANLSWADNIQFNGAL